MDFRYLQLAGKIFLPLVLLSWLTGAGAQTPADAGQPVTPMSTIEIPVRLALEPLTRAADQTLPRQAGHWQTWKSWHGIQSKYRAWRGPLSVTVSGDVLLVQAHIRYWIMAHRKVLGAINLKGSCGIDEPPRQAVIGMLVRLGWSPDWNVLPEFRILPTRFLDRCEMTVANIDVTPLVEKEFRKQMQESLRTALRTLAPGLHALRKQAQRTWQLLQEPVELGQDQWLLFRPAGVALSGIRGQGKHIDTHLAIRLQPVFLTGARPTATPIRLPPLERHYPRYSGLNLDLGIYLDFASLGQELSSTLAGKSLAVHGHDAGIRKITLGGNDEEIRARVEISGDVAGTMDLRARLLYNHGERKLALQDLAFDYEADNPLIAQLEKTFHEFIRQSLEDAANQALVQHLDRLRSRLATVLEKILPAGISLDMSSLRFRTLGVHIAQQAIRLDGTATGKVRLVLR